MNIDSKARLKKLMEASRFQSIRQLVCYGHWHVFLADVLLIEPARKCLLSVVVQHVTHLLSSQWNLYILNRKLCRLTFHNILQLFTHTHEYCCEMFIQRYWDINKLKYLIQMRNMCWQSKSDKCSLNYITWNECCLYNMCRKKRTHL